MRWSCAWGSSGQGGAGRSGQDRTHRAYLHEKVTAKSGRSVEEGGGLMAARWRLNSSQQRAVAWCRMAAPSAVPNHTAPAHCTPPGAGSTRHGKARYASGPVTMVGLTMRLGPCVQTGPVQYMCCASAAPPLPHLKMRAVLAIETRHCTALHRTAPDACPAPPPPHSGARPGPGSRPRLRLRRRVNNKWL